MREVREVKSDTSLNRLQIKGYTESKPNAVKITNLALVCHLLAGNDGQFLKKISSFYNDNVYCLIPKLCSGVMLCELTGWEMLLVSQSARLSRARRWLFPALSGDRDWDLGMSDLVLLCLSLSIQPPRLLPWV